MQNMELEIQQLVNIKGWPREKVIEYLRRVQEVASKGFTLSTIDEHCQKLAAIDAEFGIEDKPELAGIIPIRKEGWDQDKSHLPEIPVGDEQE